MKVLLVKTSSMGDIIHALPVAHDICCARADIELHWAAEESFQEIPTLAANVRRVQVSAFRRWRKHPFSQGVRQEVAALKRAMQAEHYDLVLDLQGLVRSALLCRWSGATVAGYTFSTLREPLAGLFYDRRLDFAESLGAVRRYRLAAAAALNYTIDPALPVFALSPQRTLAEPLSGDFVGLAVNTSRDEKLWPEEHWVALGMRLRAVGLRCALFWGNEIERERVERLAARIADAVVVPRRGLAATAATLAEMRGVIGVDTGLTHLGAALGRPSVGIFVSTPTETLKLYGDGPVTSLGGVGTIPSVEQVHAAFDKVLGESR